MLKDSQTPIHPTRRTHRTYTREFKAQLVAACQQPGVSIAALATSQAMNANVLHRWLKEHARSGCHQLNAASPSGSQIATLPAPAFIPVRLPAVRHEPSIPALKVEIHKGALSMTITWPINATSDFAQWSATILK